MKFMKSSIQQYIQDVIRKDARIKYDASVKQWSGVLHHESGLIYSQQKTKPAVVKEMEEVFEEFLVRFLKEKNHRNMSPLLHAKTHPAQVSRAYRQA